MKRFALWLIGLYQAAFANRSSPCRFIPSCSTYTMEAIEVHGVVKGSCMGGWRICRCNPWGGHGLDPVPPRNLSRKSFKSTPASPLRNEDPGSCLT